MKKVELWEVYYQSEYYDGDGDLCPINIREYVVANSRKEAIEKATPAFKKGIRKRPSKTVKDNEVIKASVVDPSEFLVARNSSNDGRLGWHSTQDFAEVKISKVDSEKYEFVIKVVTIK